MQAVMYIKPCMNELAIKYQSVTGFSTVMMIMVVMKITKKQTNTMGF